MVRSTAITYFSVIIYEEAAMNIGMLWFDNDPKAEINVKIERAVAFYRTKYGKTPNLCFVHPSMLRSAADEPQRLPSPNGSVVEVRASRSVLPNHFWIGVSNGATPGGASPATES
jgi:hypothetical protein